jgi:hypothetical protein
MATKGGGCSCVLYHVLGRISISHLLSFDMLRWIKTQGYIPVVPHKAVAEVSKIGNIKEG